MTLSREPALARIRFLILLTLLIGSATSIGAEISVRGRLTHELELLPGSTHSGTIVIQNVGNRTEEVKLYQTDYRSESPSFHHYEDAGTNQRSNSSWISFSPSRFTVPPDQSHTISYVLEVPMDESLSGTYWSVLMVEAIPPESPESIEADPDRPRVAVLQLIRYAVRLITHIDSTGTVEPEILGASLSLENGRPVLGVGLANTGTRSLKIDIWAEVYDVQGSLVARRDGSGSTLFPDSTREYRIPLHELARGEYTALVVIDAGDNNVFGASFPLRLE